jgi:hypothetical protein
MREHAGGRQMKSVWEIPPPDREEKRFGKHPTQKPVALLERIIQAASNPGDLVLDPFMGSGTTAVAALRLRRSVFGLELQAISIELALARIVGELIRVNIQVASFRFGLDLWGRSVDRSDPASFSKRMPPLTKLVQRECRFYFIGLERGEVIYSVEARSLDEAWQTFRTSSESSEAVLSIIKTETEIYLAQ